MSRESSSQRSCVTQRSTQRGNWEIPAQPFDFGRDERDARRALCAAKSLHWTWISINLTVSMVCEQFPPKPLKTMGREKRKSLQMSTRCGRLRTADLSTRTGIFLPVLAQDDTQSDSRSPDSCGKAAHSAALRAGSSVRMTAEKETADPSPAMAGSW